MKNSLGKVIASRIKSGEVIGLGSGSTVEAALLEIGARIRAEKLTVFGVPTSSRTALLASEAGITVLSPLTSTPIDWAFDGADEVDDNLQMIKGRGAAMLNEKIIAKRAASFVVIVSEEKLVKILGTKFPVPIEIIPEAVSLVQTQLPALGAKEIKLRMSTEKYGPVITEHNNFVLDVRFSQIGEELEKEIKIIPGVVESGLFFGFNPEVLVQRKDGIWARMRKGKEVREIAV